MGISPVCWPVLLDLLWKELLTETYAGFYTLLRPSRAVIMPSALTSF